MATHTASHPRALPVTALIVGGVGLVAAIVYVFIPVSTMVTIISGVLGAIAVVLGIVAVTRHSDRNVATWAIIVGAAAILVAIGILTGMFGSVSMGGGMSGGGYTY